MYLRRAIDGDIARFDVTEAGSGAARSRNATPIDSIAALTSGELRTHAAIRLGFEPLQGGFALTRCVNSVALHRNTTG